MLSDSSNKYNLDAARIVAFDSFFNPFRKKFNETKIAIVGSIRRKSPEVGDIDIVIASKNMEIVKWSHHKLSKTPPIIFPEPSRIVGELEKIPTQIFFCEESTWGPMLLMRTGPMDFNMKLASIAKRIGLHFSDKGLCKRNPNGSPGTRIDNNTEGDIINILLNCSWIPPEKRGIR